MATTMTKQAREEWKRLWENRAIVRREIASARERFGQGDMTSGQFQAAVARYVEAEDAIHAWLDDYLETESPDP